VTVSAHNVSVSFGGVKALNGVSMSATPGRILGLVGPNGAGKTTLFNCLTGAVAPTGGNVKVGNRDVTNLRMDQRVDLGLSRTFQTPRVDLQSTVLDAAMLGFNRRERQSRVKCFLGTPSVARTEARIATEALRILDGLGLAEKPEQPAGNLSLGQLRLLEVARALGSKPQYLLLDEPAAGLDQADRDRLATAVRRAAADGIGVILIEHNVGFVGGLSDEMLALVGGEVVAYGKPADVIHSERVIEAYLGPNHEH